MTTRPLSIAAPLLAALAWLLVADPSGALTIRAESIQPSSANAPDFSIPHFSRFTSIVDIPRVSDAAADEVGRSAWAETRYLSSAEADGTGIRDASFLARSAFTTRFTASAPAGVVYDVEVNLSRRGYMRIFDNGEGGAYTQVGAANVQVRHGTTTRTAQLGHGRTLDKRVIHNDMVPSQTGHSSTTTVNDSNRILLSGLTGTQNIVVDVSWNQDLRSENCFTRTVLVPGPFGPIRTVQSCASLPLAGDPAGVVLGYPTAYPGIGQPTGGGALVMVVANVVAVPEPASASLLALGLVGLARARRRA